MKYFNIISKYKYHFTMNIVVFLWGSTALLGKLISLPSLHLTWLRMIIASLFLTPFFLFKIRRLDIISKHIGLLFLNGLIIALHWVFFFHSVKISTVSLALICLSSAPFFTSLIQTYILKEKLNFHEFVSGGLLFSGMFLIVCSLEGALLEGVFFALVASLGQAFFTIINSKLIKYYHSFTLVFYELLIGSIFLSFFIFPFVNINQIFISLDKISFLLLLFLSIICTSFCYFLSIWALKGMSPFTSNLMVNLEPIYGSAFAFFFIGKSEFLPKSTLLGACLVLSCLFYNLFINYRLSKKLKSIRGV